MGYSYIAADVPILQTHGQLDLLNFYILANIIWKSIFYKHNSCSRLLTAPLLVEFVLSWDLFDWYAFLLKQRNNKFYLGLSNDNSSSALVFICELDELHEHSKVILENNKYLIFWSTLNDYVHQINTDEVLHTRIIIVTLVRALYRFNQIFLMINK